MQLDVVQSMLDCLYAKCTPYITDCVMAELEKLGQKYRVALRIAKVFRPAFCEDGLCVQCQYHNMISVITFIVTCDITLFSLAGPTL